MISSLAYWLLRTRVVVLRGYQGSMWLGQTSFTIVHYYILKLKFDELLMFFFQLKFV